VTPALRPARRLAVAVLLLVAVDQVEPRILSSLETARYEDPTTDFRFENSDLFGVAPLVDYLQEHPRGRQPRVMFLGNSVTYGYALDVKDAVPAQFQQLLPSHKVFNVGVNAFEAGSAYLVAKAAIGSIDEAYLLSRTYPVANPLMAKLVDVEPADRAAFALAEPPGRLDQLLVRTLSSWRLYRDSYRLQAALFGTSSRQFIYLNKSRFARAVIAPLRAQEPTATTGPAIEATTPLAPAMPPPSRIAALRAAGPPLVWQFADLFARHGRTLALLQLPGYAEWLPEAELADFNRVAHPHVRIVRLRIPTEWMFDNVHVTADGARAVAQVLAQERRRFLDQPR
jgi:hypothetical protein